jgi:hypothetical protein
VFSLLACSGAQRPAQTVIRVAESAARAMCAARSAGALDIGAEGNVVASIVCGFLASAEGAAASGREGAAYDVECIGTACRWSVRP